MKYLSLLDQLTVEEKIALVSGTDFMRTNPIKRLSIPQLITSDGPHGLRKQSDSQDNGVSQSEPSTAFPTACSTASSFNPENLYLMGKAMGEECRYYDVNVLLGPAINIKRNPLCGRNFEYFSEDPYLAGKMGAQEVKGIQEQGVGVSVKHFSMNNSENYRFMGNSIADVRAMREIYFKPFEMVVKEAQPYTLMCAYNRINGTFCSENKFLLTDVLRKEWGFDGLVMTDWGAIKDRNKALEAGLDLEMPGDTAICRKWIYEGVKNKTLDIKYLNQSVSEVLKLIDRTYHEDKVSKVDFESHHELSVKIAEDSAVLMKNEGMLPLDNKEKLLIVGELFEKMRYQGSGSSMIHATKVVSPMEYFNLQKVDYDYAKGYKENTNLINQDLENEALKKAQNYDKVVFFAGLTDLYESEGEDRANMKLMDNQIHLIESLAKLHKKIIVVFYGGSVVELPFINQVDAMLNMFLPGQGGGQATYDLLFGLANPSGKLSETWPKSYLDVPNNKDYGKKINEVYLESIYVGYRYYQKANIDVAFPFGFGLSYTTFKMDGLEVIKEDNKVVINVNATNSGKLKGKEVVQVYVSNKDSKLYQPLSQLKGFAKVELQPGETKKVRIEINNEDLMTFSSKLNKFVLENGSYLFSIGNSSSNLLLKDEVELGDVELEEELDKDLFNKYQKMDISKISLEDFEKMAKLKIPEEPKDFPLTLESRFTSLNQTLLGKILFKAVLSVANKQLKAANKMEEGPEKDNSLKGAIFLKRILESNSLRSMSMSAGRSFSYSTALGFMNLANRHLFKGIKCFLTKIDAPKLPKEEQ